MSSNLSGTGMSCLNFARESRDLAETCSIISLLLSVGNSTKIPLRRILTYLLGFLDAISESSPKSQNLSESINDVFALFSKGLSTIWSKQNNDYGDDKIIYDVVGKIFIKAALFLRGDSFESFTCTMIHNLEHIREVSSGEKRDQKQGVFFSAWTMIDILHDKILRADRNMGAIWMKDVVFRQIKHALSELLHLEGALRTDATGNTLLHLTAKFFELQWLYILKADVDTFEFILSIITMIICHGCPVDARNNDGFTAVEWAVHKYIDVPAARRAAWRELQLHFYEDNMTEFDRNDPTFVRLLDALSGHSPVLSLQELSARVILKWRIQYRDNLPISLHGVVAGF